MNFDTLLKAELARCADTLPEWTETIRNCASRFSADAHGDFITWRDAFERIANGSDLLDALQAFKPWRKGPWQFGEIHIDTEWRSDWKWARVAPHLPDLQGARILDVGCGNGFFGWQMLDAGARAVVGIDPTLLYCLQHLVVTRLKPAANNFVLPLTLEESPPCACFDVTFSMGVIYHRRDPADHVQRLASSLRPGGTVVLESLIVHGDESLYPTGRYARMRNVPVVPSIRTLEAWLHEAGFGSIRVVDITTTTFDEQRTTPWMPFESLREALNPEDQSRTVEGHPAPVRAVVLAEWPA